MNRNRILIAATLLAVLLVPAIALSADTKTASDHAADNAAAANGALAKNSASERESAEEAFAKKWIAAWNSHNPEKMLPLFADDIVYEDVAYGEISHGHTELRKFAADEFEAVPDLDLKLLHASVANNHATIEWSFSGTDKGIYKSGKKFTVRGVSVIDLRGGKIVRNLDFYDSAAIMRQAGVLPAQ
ncbi:MAG: nuclear transport factor 2 family protein [Terriglobales bacterium]